MMFGLVHNKNDNYNVFKIALNYNSNDIQERYSWGQLHCVFLKIKNKILFKFKLTHLQCNCDVDVNKVKVVSGVNRPL